MEYCIDVIHLVMQLYRYHTSHEGKYNNMYITCRLTVCGSAKLIVGRFNSKVVDYFSEKTDVIHNN